MEKPKPIAEVVVTTNFSGSSVLHIMAASADADSWIRDNAPEFGILFVPENSMYLNSFSLHVDTNYKADEVTAYLRAMGEDAQ